MKYRRYDDREPIPKVKDLIRFLEWTEYRDELREKKHDEKKKKDTDKKVNARALTFAEGMLLAFMLQWFVAPIVHSIMKANGLN